MRIIKKTKPKHIMVKLLRAIEKEKNIKDSQHRGMKADFLLDIIQSRDREKEHLFKNTTNSIFNEFYTQ